MKHMNTTPKKKRIALVGGAGFIGHNLALHLAQQGHEVHVIDNLGVNNLLYLSSSDKNVADRELYLRVVTQRMDLLRKHQISFYGQDARDYHDLSLLLGKIQPEVLVLLAAVSHADRSNKDPFNTFDHSFRTLENALDASRNSSIEHFIYFSSSMVYGNFPDGFVSEDTPCNPLGIYGALKFGGEKLVIAYNQVFGLPYTILRPSALYGERCVSRRVAQIFVENAVQGRNITINGDGSDRLDFTYIGDLVDGIARVIDNERSRNQIFNMTYGQSRSLSELAEIVASHFPNIRINYLPKDNLMPERGTLSNEKAHRLLSYEPQFPLEKGMARYISWYRSLCNQPRALRAEAVSAVI
jgi:nucleoside-diphosphate-sugar epimerase